MTLFIDLANEMDEEAAMIFLDQEKAFDRVNHTVLLKRYRPLAWDRISLAG